MPVFAHQKTSLRHTAPAKKAVRTVPAPDLFQAGPNQINASLDAIDPDIFRAMSGGRGRVEQVLRDIDAAAQSGL